jgi:hypothetical protein
MLSRNETAFGEGAEVYVDWAHSGIEPPNARLVSDFERIVGSLAIVQEHDACVRKVVRSCDHAFGLRGLLLQLVLDLWLRRG